MARFFTLLQYFLILRQTHTNKIKSGGTLNRVIPNRERTQPIQNEELIPKRGTTSVAWMRFGYEKSDST